MRIVYSHRIQSRDGQGVHVEAIVAALRDAGHTVLVVGPSFYDQAAFGGESRWVALIRRCLPGALSELAELAYNAPAYWRLRRACRDFKPDLLYERYNLFYLAGALVARQQRLLFYAEVNAPLAAERTRHGSLRLQKLARLTERFVWRSADRVMAVTGVLRDMVAAAGAPASRIEVTQNGIDPARFAPPRPRGDGPIVLGFVGFVRDWHGLGSVIDALASEAGTELRLTIVGEGPARSALQRQAAALGIAERVVFTGGGAHEAVRELVAGFDIALQPRVVAYASPLKIFEYMAAGRAIVAPDQPNIREILEHGRTALLFDPGEPGGAWQAITRLVADPGLRARLGEAARAEIQRRNFTWRGNADRIVTWARADLSAEAPSAPVPAAFARGS